MDDSEVRPEGFKIERFVIELDSDSDCETSSEISEYGDDEEDLFEDLSINLLDVDDAPMAHLLESLISAISDEEKERVLNNVLNYLHSTPVTLEDLKILLPEFMRNVKLMNKLATNIGWYHARGQISEPDLEKMLEYIFTKGDCSHILSSGGRKHPVFEKVQASVNRFRLEKANNMHQNRVPYWVIQHEINERHKEAMLQAQREKEEQLRREQEEELLGEQIRLWKSMVGSGFYPGGAETFAELITEVYGLSYTAFAAYQNTYHARFLRQSAQKYRVSKVSRRPSLKKHRLMSVQSQIEEIPGLEQLNQPCVGLPSPERDMRAVETLPSDVTIHRRRKYREAKWATSAGQNGGLFSKTKKKNEVCLPPKP